MNKDVGAYVLTHRPTGVYYIGSSGNVSRRVWHHHYHLGRGDHHCARLQAVYTTESDCSLEFIPAKDRDDAFATEQRLLDGNFGNALLANSNRCATSGLGTTKSEETREKIRAGTLGREVPLDRREVIRSKLKGRKLSDEHRENQTATRRNRPRTEAEAQHLSNIRAMVMRAVVIDGHEYQSIAAAGEALGIPANTVKSRLVSTSERFASWYFKA